MNMYRQNNRYITPSGASCGRSATVQCETVCSAAVPVCNDGYSGVIGRYDTDCAPETTLGGMPLAMAYVPWQSFDKLYSVSQALQCGTLFQELSLDFLGRRCN